MRPMIEQTAMAIELAGVATMVLGGVLATAVAAAALFRHERFLDVYRGYRAGLGRSILLGLEFLVAADIIQTILIRPTLSGAGALALIVLIRTFLSFSLETEIEGRLPWQRAEDGKG